MSTETLIFVLGILVAGIFQVVFYKKGLLPTNIKRYEIPGKGSPDQISNFVKLCQKAKYEIFAVGGECSYVLWDNDVAIAAIEEAIAKGKKISICSGPWFDVKSKKLAKLINDGKVNYYWMPDREPKNHFQANDNYDIAYHRGDEGSKEIIISGSENSYQTYRADFLNKIYQAKKVENGYFFENFGINDNNLCKKYKTEFWFTNTEYYRNAELKEIAELESFLENGKYNQ